MEWVRPSGNFEQIDFYTVQYRVDTNQTLGWGDDTWANVECSTGSVPSGDSRQALDDGAWCVDAERVIFLFLFLEGGGNAEHLRLSSLSLACFSGL